MAYLIMNLDGNGIHWCLITTGMLADLGKSTLSPQWACPFRMADALQRTGICSRPGKAADIWWGLLQASFLDPSQCAAPAAQKNKDCLFMTDLVFGTCRTCSDQWVFLKWRWLILVVSMIDLPGRLISQHACGTLSWLGREDVRTVPNTPSLSHSLSWVSRPTS